MAGVEPATSTFVASRAIQLRHIPEKANCVGWKNQGSWNDSAEKQKSPLPGVLAAGLNFKGNVFELTTRNAGNSPCQKMNAITAIAAAVAADGGDREEVRHGNHSARHLGANNVKTYI